MRILRSLSIVAAAAVLELAATAELRGQDGGIRFVIEPHLSACGGEIVARPGEELFLSFSVLVDTQVEGINTWLFAVQSDNGEIEITDAILVLRELFIARRLIREPGPDVCGLDPSADGLGCRGINACR